jgi:hypothetical protein
MYMGDYIVIDHTLRPFEFACESVSTGTLLDTRVDNDRRKIFSDYTFPDQQSTACRFLRPNEISYNALFTGIVRRNANFTVV